MKKLMLFVLFAAVAGGFASAQALFKVTSSAVSGKGEKGFDSGLISDGRADSAYNGDVSLPFSWSGVPKGTKSIVVVYDDPDARLVMKAFGVSGEVWTHWVVADIDPELGGLPANAANSGRLVMGKNTWGNAAYGGPAPPADVPSDAKRPIVHVYRLKVFALSAKTGLKPGFSLEELSAALKGKVLATAQLNLSWSN